jgi:O-6-methylguanine DNA methyltransferase
LSHSCYGLFETPLGWCGIAWNEDPKADIRYKITHLQLPEATQETTQARIARNCAALDPVTLPPPINNVRDRLLKHLRGDMQDFRDVPVDLTDVGPFVQRVCGFTREIPAGQTVTYADIAAKLGGPSLARAVGRALGMNPIPIIIPCHRVTAAHGKPGGFSAHGGRAIKAKLLAIEGARINYYLDLQGSA